MPNRVRLLARKTFTAFRLVLLFLGMFLAGCLVRSWVDRPATPVGHNHGHQGAVATDHTAVRMTVAREGDTTHVFVENLERSEITMTFGFHTVNLKSTVEFPYTATFPPGRTRAFVLSPLNPDEQWEYCYTNYYKLGSSVAVPDDYVYQLPYAPGRTYKVTQGYNGKFSHKGSNQFAIDWQMPEGTPVRAARGGLVVKVKDDSSKGGGSMEYDRHNNFVLIRHDDGTLGHYCHLKKRGVKVVPGQTVQTGDVIALSGNTGYSSGAHLHFSVFKTKDGRDRISLPVKFRNADGDAVTLVEGRRYRAPAVSGEPPARTVSGPTVKSASADPNPVSAMP